MKTIEQLKNELQAASRAWEHTSGGTEQETRQAYESFSAALERLKTAEKYGPDMQSSRDLCISDATEILNNFKNRE